jgi:hypothetical protein
VVAGPWSGSPKPVPEKDAKAAEHEQAVYNLLLGWYARGTETFTVSDVTTDGILGRIGVTRPWLYQFLDDGVNAGRLAVVAEKPKKRWRVVPPRQAAAEEEM